MAKQVLFNEQARAAIKRGIDTVADAVRITIGPRGRNVAVEKGYGSPTITNDGVSIAKEISLSDKAENVGAEIIKEVAEKTNEAAGDGTTTSMVLMQAIAHEGLKRTAMGINPMGLRQGIEVAAREVVAELVAMAKPIKDKSEITQVATISAESEEIGKIITDAIDKVGNDGVVTVEESQTFGVESDVVEGMQFDKGYLSPYMVTNSERMEAEYTDAPILITDKKISSIKDVLPILEKLAQSGKKDLVIIADDVDGEALATLVVNKLRGAFNALAIKAPGYGDRKKEMLADIATMTGGTVISEEVGIRFDSADLSMLGSARRVVADKEKTTIVGGKGDKEAIDKRAAQIRIQIEQTKSQFDKDKLQERLGKLTSGVAVIRVGAATETEMKYKKLKIEDAVEATKAAIAEGIVPGGGIAFIRAMQKVATKNLEAPNKDMLVEFNAGVEVLLKALESPIRQIAQNAGKGDGSIIVEHVKQSSGMAGYNAGSDKMVDDMLVAGIIDPVKVARTALENAASAAAIFLTTDAVVVDEPKKEGASMPMGDPGMGGMGF
ncbi:MAG: chaperonin GroEL [bacterium]|nr:chaperonin GroEL [bacterium]